MHTFNGLLLIEGCESGHARGLPAFDGRLEVVLQRELNDARASAGGRNLAQS